MKKERVKTSLFTLVAIIMLFFYVQAILATTFISSVTPVTVDATSYAILNFSVNNTGSQNIAQVNITMWPGFSFVGSSNSTTAINTAFSNTSDTLIWDNTTTGGFVSNGTIEYFSMNVSVPSLDWGINFTVFTLDTNQSTSAKNVTVVVNDTTAPQYSINSTNNTGIGLATEFRLYWSDNVDLGAYIFSTNNTGTWINDSSVPMGGSANWSNVTKTLNNTVGIAIGWRVYADDNSNNWDASEVFTFVTSDVGGTTIPPTYSNLYNSLTNNTTITVGDAINLGALWNDNINLSHYTNASSANGSSFVNGTWMPFVSSNWSNFSIVYPSSGAGGNYSVKIYANDSHGNENVTGLWIWYNNTFVPGSPFIPGGGSGDIPIYLVNRKKGNINITITSVDAGDKQSVAVLRTEDMSFRRVIVYAKNSLNNIKIMVTKLEGLPASVTRDISGETYHYINVTTDNFTDPDLDNATIEFAIPKLWLEDNNIDRLNITLYRWQNQNWNALPTTQISETVTEVFYSAVTSGFSYFVIGTIEIIPAAPTCVENWICTEWSSCVDGKETITCTDSHDCGTESNKPETSRDCILEQILVGAEDLGVGGILVASGIILVIVVMILLLVKGKKMDLSFLKQKKKFKYKYKHKGKK
jgi:PGF-pre-PGF domain-containing protein